MMHIILRRFLEDCWEKVSKGGIEMITLRTIKFIMKDGELIRISDTINPNLKEDIEQLEKEIKEK